MGAGFVVEREARYGEDSQRKEHRRHGGAQHVADVGEDVDPDGRGGQHRGVGEQRQLVAEVGARDDGSGHPAFGESHRPADAHQCHADGGDGRPRTSGHQRHSGADDRSGYQEERRMQDFQTVAYHRRDYAADHPRPCYGADEQQDDDGRRRSADVVDDGFFEHRPAAAVDAYREHHADRGGRQQGDLAASVDGAAAEAADHYVEQQREYRQRDDRHPRRRCFRCFVLHFSDRIT